MKELNDKQLHCRFKQKTWDKVESAKRIYLEAIKDTDLAKSYVNNLMVNKAVDVFYSDNVLEEISNLSGLKPKVLDISEWIDKNWQKFRINPMIDDNDVYHIRCDYQIDFDITIDITRDSEGNANEIFLIKDQSLYIEGVELVWKIEDLDILKDYLI